MSNQTLGRCYLEAFEYMCKNGGALVHGSKTVMGNGRQRTTLHAWVLVGSEALYDPEVAPEMARILSRAPSKPEHDYTTVNYRYRERYRYSHKEAVAWSDKTGSAGPWEGTYWRVDDAGAVVRRNVYPRARTRSRD